MIMVFEKGKNRRKGTCKREWLPSEQVPGVFGEVSLY